MGSVASDPESAAEMEEQAEEMAVKDPAYLAFQARIARASSQVHIS